jgi:hypothetical protein
MKDRLLDYMFISFNRVPSSVIKNFATPVENVSLIEPRLAVALSGTPSQAPKLIASAGRWLIQPLSFLCL